MNVEFSNEQISLSDSVRRLLERDATPAALRKLWSTESGRDSAVWEQLAQIGIPAILVPEEYGGLGGTLLDLVLVLEEIGRAALPDAIVESCVLAPVLLSSCADSQLSQEWLSAIAEGARVTVTRPDTHLAPDVHVSDAVIVVGQSSAVFVEAADAEVEPLLSMDPSSRVFRVGQPVAGKNLVDADVRMMQAFRAVSVAAVLGGVSARLIELTTEYVKIRHQFGRPIGSFQAVKHQLAQAESMCRMARWPALAAAQQVASGAPEAADAATLAMLCASDAEKECNRVALQLHGGIGFTWEHDLQLWLKFGKTLETAHWPARALAARAGEVAVDSSAPHAV